MDTAPLFLDEALQLGVKAVVGAPYPPMTSQERFTLEDCAAGLCLSLSSLAWAWHQGRKGNDDGWRRIRRRLLSKPVAAIFGGNPTG